MTKHITQDDVIYFIMTDRFFGQNKKTVNGPDATMHGGTLDGILEKLDYLIELGITAVWVTPVYKNIPTYNDSKPYHYYWAEDFRCMDERLLDGTHLPQKAEMKTFAKFVKACEDKKIKVILDMVVNHAGYKARDKFPADWFNAQGSGDTETELAGLPDFNHDNPNVLDYFIDNIRDWIVDGKITNIRMDTVKHVEPRFWHYFTCAIRGQFPEVYMLGEVLFERREDVGELLKYQNYHDFDSIFDFPLCTALRSTFIYDESISQWLARSRLNNNEPLGVLDEDNAFKDGYRNPNGLVTLLDNHDIERRIISHARTKHAGEEGLPWAIRVTKLCLGALFTMRGIPQLYYGTEVGMEGWKEGSDDRRLRGDFPWEVIGANQQPLPKYAKEREIYLWVRDLIRLRKERAALRYGTTITLWADHLVYAFLRVSLDDVVLVVINNGYLPMPGPIHIPLNSQMIPDRVINLVKTGMKHWKTGAGLVIQDEKIVLTVDGKSIEIFVKQ